MRNEQTIYTNKYYAKITEKVKEIEGDILSVLPENFAKAIANFIEQEPMRLFIGVQYIINRISK